MSTLCGLTPATLTPAALPAKAIVSKGYLGRTDEDTLAQGEEFHLLHRTTDTVVEARDRHKRLLSIPKKTPAMFLLLDDGSADKWAKDKGEAHADYEAIWSISDLVAQHSFPLSVRMLPCDGNDSAQSSSFALTLMRETTTELLLIATNDMELLAIPLDLDVEFDIIQNRRGAAHPPPKILPRRPPDYAAQTNGPDYVVAHDNPAGASAGTYITLTGEQIKYDSRDAPAPVYADLETSQISRGDSEELYESLMDYQSVKTISKKGVTLRMGMGHSLNPSLGIAAADSAARRQLAKAKKNLGATKRLEKGANTGSPMLSFWLKEIARLERQLATSSQSQHQPPVVDLAVMATVHKMAGEKLGISLSDRNLIKVVRADSPCARTGTILVGDEIIGVNGISVEGNRDECLRQLKEAGPKIEFRLRRRSPLDSASPPPIAKPAAPAVPTAHPAIFLPNKAEIATLDVAGVGALLAKLRLDSHVRIFEENVITGKVFLGLDDDTLMSDLAVIRKLDRLKILQFQE